ncbi:MAG: hypothetical protein HOW73_29210 [Polyangiaceae bacterium]|nr:hypothetical protein [Polyangiaceae bacterium]
MEIGGQVVPLHAGSVHYWRLDPKDWRACLLATKALGLKIVDTYIPWSVHELAPGVLELGQSDPQRDVAAFLKLAHELGLYAIVRPGPHINAELTFFGIPERVVWDPACQARSPQQNPVVLPMLPQAFPVPSYASEVFLDETARFFRALAPALVPLLYPAGPIVMIQVDNEGAMYFRDGAYDQDYHPDAIALYRTFLRDKYRSIEDLSRAYGFDPSADGAPRFGDLQPPTKFDAKTPADLVRHVDWAEFHEHLLARAMQRFADALAESGIDGIPRSHNFPPGQESTPLNAARVQGAVDLIGYDYYNKASSSTRVTLMRRTTELAVRSDALGLPAFGCEMGAGFPPFFPPLEERDSVFTMLTALAYGLRGFNLYMAVERDRWIGAPIDPHGRERPFSLFWRKLTGALDRLEFAKLQRRCPVRIVIPRNERRLARVTHAFGPISGAFFSVAGAGARESCFEDDLGLGYAPAVEADAFTRMLESALEARGVPFAHVGGEDRDVSLEGASWICCVTSGGLSPTLFGKLVEAAASGALVTLGPRAPELGGARRALVEPLDLSALARASHGLPTVCAADPAAVESIVARAIDTLALPAHGIDPDDVFATIHEDEGGTARVLFLINPSSNDCGVRITLDRSITSAVDVLKEQTHTVTDGALDVRVKPKTVRMLALS